MTLQEVKDAVEEIRAHAASDDGPRAHSAQDRLYEKFIRHVAETAYGDLAELAEMAKHILTTADLDFDKWYE